MTLPNRALHNLPADVTAFLPCLPACMHMQVHLVGDERGAVLEAVVSRMKTLSASTEGEWVDRRSHRRSGLIHTPISRSRRRQKPCVSPQPRITHPMTIFAVVSKGWPASRMRIVALSATDYVEVSAFQNSGGGLNVTSDCWFSMTWVSL